MDNSIGRTVGSGGVTRYALVKYSTSSVVVTAADTDAAFGIAQDGAAAGEKVEVKMWGRTFAVASAAITIGAKLMPAASGKVATHTGNVGEVFIGEALQAADADGDEIEILLYTEKRAQEA